MVEVTTFVNYFRMILTHFNDLIPSNEVRGGSAPASLVMACSPENTNIRLHR
jgi:hypothetical protein